MTTRRDDAQTARTLERIEQARVIAIVRADSGKLAVRSAEALLRAGVTALEVSLNTPNACEVVAELCARAGDAVIGAGTVITSDAAERAIVAGARFLVSPVLEPDVLAIAAQARVVSVPGCFTPTEVAAALRYGADLIKLFPASTGGVAHLRALRQVLPEAKFVPAGGVSVESAVDWLAAGATALVIGSSLTGEGPNEVTARVAKLFELVAAASQ